MNTTALITGITGQDGAYLAAQLLREGKTVVGTLRSNKNAESLWRLRELGIADHPQLRLSELDMTNATECASLLAAESPFSLFHFAAKSGVADSFRDPIGASRVNALGTLNLLEAIRHASPQTRFVVASSAEIFGNPQNAVDETASIDPRNPYAISKYFAHASTVTYRDNFGLHASCAILFNHESPLRGAGFVTRKIADAAARLANSDGEPLRLGNLDAQRDYGYAPEYVDAMAKMVDLDRGDDFVLATGVATSVRDFATFAFAAAEIDLEWRGVGADEHAVDRKSGRIMIRIDPILLRPSDARALIGNSAKARERLGFAPRTDVRELARVMVAAEIRRRAVS